MRLNRAICGFVICLLALPSFGQDEATSSDLIKRAMLSGNVEKAIITGETQQYLQKSLKTDKTIYGTARVVKRLSPKCARTRLEISIPDLIVTATNPANPKEKKTGPFESSLEGNFCDNG